MTQSTIAFPENLTAALEEELDAKRRDLDKMLFGQ